MYRKVEVIPYSYLENPETGATASFWGACPPGYVTRVKGYTWRCVKRDGTVTIGLCRRPADTVEEANAIAEEVGARSRDCAVVRMR